MILNKILNVNINFEKESFFLQYFYVFKRETTNFRNIQDNLKEECG